MPTSVIEQVKLFDKIPLRSEVDSGQYARARRMEYCDPKKTSISRYMLRTSSSSLAKSIPYPLSDTEVGAA